MKIAGIIFILIGFALTAFRTISIFGQGSLLDPRGAVIANGAWYSYSWSPILGIALILIGGSLIFSAPRRDKIGISKIHHG